MDGDSFKDRFKLAVRQKKMIKIREEQPQDLPGIREVNERAFGQPQEADIVDNVRQNCSDRLSLLAVVDDQVIGHVLFSTVIIESEDRTLQGVGLAPMAVLPEYQRQRIGGSGIRSDWEVPDDAFMVLVLDESEMQGISGVARYRPEFAEEMR